MLFASDFPSARITRVFSIYLGFLGIHHDCQVTREKSLAKAADRPMAKISSKVKITR